MRFVFALLFVMILSACQKVIDLNLRNAPGKYVVEGNVTNLPGPYQVTIGRTGEGTTDYSFAGVGGATVSIRDNTGNGETLVEVQPGVYQTKSLQGVEGRTYYLNI